MTTPDVIFFGHGLVADQIRRNLADLATLGLIDPFSWIDPRLPDAAATVRHISAEGQQITHVDTALRSVQGTLLFIALDVEDDVTTGLDMAGVDRWTSCIEARLSATSSPARVRVLLPRLPRGGRVPAANPSWATTVAIAPEDSEAPDSPLSPLLRSGDPTEVAKVAAPTLCGLTGLWTSTDTCALLNESGHPIATGDAHQFRLARAYHRTIDASAVEDRLRRTATDIRGRLPQPVTPDGRQADHLPGADRAPEELAQRLLHQYHDALATPMQPEVHPSTSRKGWFQAVTAFLGDYFKKGLGTPASWYRTARSNAQSALDNRTQNALYGADSPVRIISNPAVGVGRSVSLDDLAVASSRHRQQVMALGLRVGDEPQLSDMWASYRNIALTLVDGAERQQGSLETPKDAYGNRKIVEQGWQSVPDVDDSFHGFDPLLGQQLGITPQDAVIPPFDAEKANTYEQRLNFVAEQSREPAIRQLQQNFARWKQTASLSFAWHTGEGLRSLLTESRNNIGFQMQRLDGHRANLAGLQQRDSATLNRSYRTTTRILLGLEIALLLIVALSVVIRHKPDWQLEFYSGFDWNWGILWLVLGTLILMGFHMSAYARARRGVEKYLHDADLLHRNVAITEHNVNQAVDNCDRQIKAYQQLLSWSTLLGRAISRPLGRDTSTGTGLESPSAGLPLSTSIGQATIPEDELGPLVNTVRREIFPPHWASDAFDRLLNDSAANREHITGENSPSLTQLSGQSGEGTGSALDKLAAWSVSPQMERRDHTREHWSSVISSPIFARDLSRRIDTVSFCVDGRLTSTTQERFLSTVRGGDQSAASFLQDAVSAAAVNSRATTVDESVSRLDDSGAHGALGTQRTEAYRSTSGWGDSTSISDVATAGTLTRSATLVQFGRATELAHLGGSAEETAHQAPQFTPPVFDTPSFNENPFPAFPSAAETPQAPQTPRSPESPARPDIPDWDSLI